MGLNTLQIPFIILKVHRVQALQTKIDKKTLFWSVLKSLAAFLTIGPSTTMQTLITTLREKYVYCILDKKTVERLVRNVFSDIIICLRITTLRTEQKIEQLQKTTSKLYD